MKFRILLFIIASISVNILFSCKEEEEPLQILPPVAGGDWVIYQLAKIPAPDIPVEDKSFSGTIGDVDISLGRIPGDTLIFLIPNIGEGPTELKVTMGKQVRTWDLQLSKWPNLTDQKTFFDLFFEKTKELQDRIQKVEKLKELAGPFETWIAFFNQKKAALTESENDRLSGILQHNGEFMPWPKDTFELECINTPDFILGSMTYKFVAFDYIYLNDYVFLPSSKYHDAVLAGIVLSIWYQKLLLEYYAHLTLECPQVRGFELKDPETGEVISPEETLELESNESVTFGHIGIFRPITVEDLSEGGPFYLQGIGFRDIEKISPFFSEVVEKYVEANRWEMPLLTPSSLILPPADAPTTKGPIQNLEWNYYSVTGNPKIRLVEFKSDKEKFTVKLESLDGNPQPFNFSISIRINSLGFEAVIPALLKVTCPILVEVLMIEKTHYIDIEFGQAPYTITWSNGVTADLSQTLSPGDYEVKVTDALDCERIVEFTVPEFGTVEDIDGNIYETVKIGDTWWMAENLRTTRKKDGTAIQLLESDAAWSSATGPAYSWKGNDSSLDESYGKLYNYSAACCDICPDGWRLPGTSEFSSLSGIFGLNYGKHLRDVKGWPSGSLKSTNLSGLRFLPSGSRSGTNGGFGTPIVELSTFWTSAKDVYGFPYIGLVQGSSDFVALTFSTNSRDGLSVRCVRND